MAEYATIREAIGEIIGQTIVEITQHDEEYWQRTGRAFVDLMLSDGDVLRVYVGDDGIALNPDDESEAERMGDIA